MGTTRSHFNLSGIISKAMLLLTFALSSSVLFSQIALRGTATSATSTTATVTVNKPTGVVSGDIMFANVGNYCSGCTQTSSTLSGWTAIAGTDTDRGRATLLYKVATGSEPASYSFAVTSSSTLATGAIVAFSGVNAATPFDVTAPNSWYTVASATPAAIPSITTVTNNSALVMFGSVPRSTSTTNSNFANASWSTVTAGALTELFDVGHNSVANGPAVGAAWAIDATAGASGLGSLNAVLNTTPRTMGGIMVALRAAPAAIVTSSASTVCGSSTINLSSVLHGNPGVSTIAFQGFETAGSTVTYAATGTGNVQSGTTAASAESPTSSPYFVSGTNGYRINNGTATITTANIGTIANYTSKSISLNLASFSVGSSTNGSDGTDNVVVAISLDGGTTWSNELQVSGNTNSYWGYASGTGVASATYDGNNTPTAYAPTAGGNRTTDGYSNLTISLPDNATQVRIRITMLNNSANETWAIDNISLSGLPTPQYSWTSTPSGFTSSAANPTSVSISATTTYNLTVTDATGFSASGSTAVTVNNVPTVATPATPSALCAGGSYNPTAPTVTANGATVTAQGWQLETAVASGTYAALTVPYTVAFADNGKRVRYTATNSCGTTNSTTVTLTVNNVPTVATPATPSALCVGNSYNPTAPTVTANGATVTAQGWQLETAVASGTYAALTVPYTVAFADNGKRVRYTAINGCGTTNSTTVTLDVAAASVGGTISGGTTVCTGSNSTTLTLSGNTGSITRWESSLDNFATAGTSIANTTTTLTATNLTATTSYRAVITNSVCASANSASATVTVTPNNTATLSSAVGTNAQTRCINTAITNITYTTTTATGATFSGLPAGVSGAWASNVATISGTPTASGTFNYTVTLTGGCGAVTATGSIIVSPNNTVGTASSSPSVCLNYAMTSITHTTTGATGIGTATGLPAGVTASFAGNTITISGSPSVSGTFNYTVPLTGGCGAALNATGTITVNIAPSGNFSYSNYGFCSSVNTSQAVATSNFTGAAGTFSSAAGLSLNATTGAILPSTSTAGNYTITYSVAATGGCPAYSTSNTITIDAVGTGTIAYSPSTICNDAAGTLSPTITGAGGTGASTWIVSAPAGLNMSAAGVITPIGSTAGTYTVTYNRSSTGLCPQYSTTASVTVSPATPAQPGTITGTATQCSALTSQTYSIAAVTNATTYNWSVPTGWSITAGTGTNSITVTVGSAGQNGNISVTAQNACGTSAARTLAVTVSPAAPAQPGTITGTATQCSALAGQTYSIAAVTNATTYNWSVPTGWSITAGAGTTTITVTTGSTAQNGNISVTAQNSCGTSVARTLAVTVGANNTVGSASSNPTVCINTAIPAITFTTTGATGIGSTTNLPAGVSASWSNNVITLNGTPTVAGTYSYTVALAGGCGTVSASGTITVQAASVAGSISGVASVCPDANSTVLTLAGSTGSIQWQSSTNNSTFSNIGSATATTYTVTNIGQATYYRVVVSNGVCAAANSASVQMTLLSVPAVTNAIVCTGNSGSMQVTCADQTGLSDNNNDAGNGANVTGIGTLAWASTGNIAGAGTAGMSIASSTTTNYLQGSVYGFAIPANAIINGITVTINRSSSGSTSPLIRDNRVSLVKGGTIQTTNKGVTATNWTNTLTDATYGGAADLWGTTWTAADINANNFGVVLSVINSNTGSSRTAAVDYMRISVSYSLPGTENWYTAVSGGSVIGTGNSFNPVGVAGSGLANTNTVGTTTYYVDCSTSGNTCRAAVDFTIIQNAIPGTISGATSVCAGSNSTLLTVSGHNGSVQWQTSSNNSTFTDIAGATSNSYTVSNISATCYYRVVVTQGSCSINGPSVTMTVLATPAVNALTGKGCTGVAFVVLPVNVDDGTVPAGTTYTWSAPSGTGFTGGSAQSIAQSSISQTLTLTGSSSAVATYIVTPRNGVCAGATFTVAVTISPNPVLAITPDYCTTGGSAILTATAGLTNYVWSNGATTASITTQQAGSYSVSASNSFGCSSTASLGVATELVANGSFEAGNTSFITGYTNSQAFWGLTPEGRYAIANNANFTHPSFYGTDHTSGSGNFMIVNGSASITTIWSQNNVAVQPNTTYYFSAWGLSVVSGNNAALQFSINGTQVGSVAYLPDGYTNTAGPYAWTRFYGQWNSGYNTSVNLSIVNLQLAASGNDFGLDDISFGTLAPTGLTTTSAANGSGAVCQGEQFFLNANPAGGASPYTYAWSGPNGFTSTQENPIVSNSATSAINGTYTITITDGLGCTGTSSATVAVSPLPTNLTPTAVAATVCAGVATSVNVPTSQTDVGYTLYNSATNAAVSATLPGTGATLSLSTGILNSTTTFYVLAAKYATGCELQLSTSVTVTVATTPVLVTNNIALCTGTANLTAASVTTGSTGGGTLTYWTTLAATTAVSTPASVASGTYYIKSTVGSCTDIEPVNVVISGTPITTFNYTGSPFCSNAVNPAPVYSGGGSAGNFTSSAGLVFVSASTGVINLAASTPGSYTITNTITPVGACTASSTSRSIVITDAPDASFSYVSNSLCQTIGGNNPAPIYPSGAQAGTFSTSAATGFNFVSTATGVVNLSTSTPGSYAVINTIGAANGCASVADTVFVDINPYTFAGSINVSSSDDQLCAGETVNFYSSGTSYLTVLERETFNGSFTPWTTSNSSTGTGTALSAWTLRPNGYSNSSLGAVASNDASQFYLSGARLQTSGTTITALTSPALNTVGFSSLSVDFYQYFNANVAGDVVKVQVSTNGSSWVDLQSYTTDQGASVTSFSNSVVSLNAYVGLPSVYVRFYYSATAGTNGRYWAIDNISITGISNRYNFNWTSVPSGFVSAEQNPANYLPSASAYYDVEAMNSYGCTVNTSPLPVIVNPLPIDNAGANLDLCAGVAGNIGAAAQATSTYSWSPATGLSNATAAQPSAAPSASTWYTLTETITATGCADTNRVYVGVRAISTVSDITQTACSGNAFSVTPVNGVNGTVLSGTQYVWAQPSGTGFSGGSAQASAQSAISQTLTASGGSAATAIYVVTPKVNGCDGATFNVQVDVTTIANAGSITGATAVCAGTNSAALSVSGSSGQLQWQSSTNNSTFTNINGETASSYTASNVANTTYYRVIASNNPCPAVTGSSVAITTIARPTATIAGTTQVCPGTPALLTLNLAGQGPWSGTLSDGQSFSSSNAQTSLSVNPSSTQSYSIATLNDANCAATSGLSGAATITVRTLPTASISGSATVCAGSTGAITFNGPANGDVEYTINGGSGLHIALNGSGSATLNTPVVYQNLSYALVNVEDGYCENTATGVAAITYQETPDATISGAAQLCTGQSTSIAFNGNANAVVTYNVNGGASQNLTLNGSGVGTLNTGALNANTTYNLVSVAAGSCASSIGTSVVISVGQTIYYQDSDGDGYGNAAASTVACTAPAGYVTNSGDCCDTNADISPLCEWWADMDNDGYGSFIYEVGCISGVSCASNTWPTQLIPYCPSAHGGAPYTVDCNDNSITIHPGAVEVCNNTIDDDCDGAISEGCSGQYFDQWSTAQVLNVINTNAIYPNCQSFNGTLVNTDVSPQGNPANVAVGGGRDTWYRFVAPSTGVRIRVTAASFNAVIELQNALGAQVDVENVNPAIGGTEILNYGNLTVGQTYYVGVRNYDATNVGTYTICVSPLMPSGCATTASVDGLSLCDGYKGIYRGATNYVFNFTGVGGNAAQGVTTSATVATTIVTLNTASLALRYGSLYDVRVDANYALPNGLGTIEPVITVLGNTSPAACQNVLMRQQPLMQARTTQVCPTAILRTAYLAADPLPGNPNVCAAINYTYEFTRVSDCSGTTVIGTPITATTTGTTPYLLLSSVFNTQLGNSGYWKVRIRANFSYGVGSYGPSSVLNISNTAASQMLSEGTAEQGSKSLQVQPLSAVYPNPNNGNEVNINLTDIGSGDLTIKIVDGLGRVVYNNRYTVDGSLMTKVNFDGQLNSGIYLIEFTINGETMNERMIVER